MSELKVDERIHGRGTEGAETTETFRCGVVALIGRANVGKSTLMNRLLGAHLSIVSDVPQTTRFPVRGVLNRDGCQIIFIDTPGIHKALQDERRDGPALDPGPRRGRHCAAPRRAWSRRSRPW